MIDKRSGRLITPHPPTTTVSTVPVHTVFMYDDGVLRIIPDIEHHALSTGEPAPGRARDAIVNHREGLEDT